MFTPRYSSLHLSSGRGRQKTACCRVVPCINGIDRPPLVLERSSDRCESRLIDTQQCIILTVKLHSLGHPEIPLLPSRSTCTVSCSEHLPPLDQHPQQHPRGGHKNGAMNATHVILSGQSFTKVSFLSGRADAPSSVPHDTAIILAARTTYSTPRRRRCPAFSTDIRNQWPQDL